MNLNITKQAAENLATQAKEDVAKRMAARVKAEEAKLQERRAKQEQHLARRVEKKALHQAAVDAESVVATACVSLEATLKTRAESKKSLGRRRDALKVKLKELEVVSARYYKAKEQMDLLEGQIKAARFDVQEMEAADVTIVEQKSQRLREAWTNSREAWAKIQKAIFKKDHDRALKKRVKGLLK